MPRGVVSESRRQQARRHADNAWTCRCGKVVYGNGGESSHKRACRVWTQWQLDQRVQTLVEIDAGTWGRSMRPETVQRFRGRYAREIEQYEALLARWPEGERRPKDETDA